MPPARQSPPHLQKEVAQGINVKGDEDDDPDRKHKECDRVAHGMVLLPNPIADPDAMRN